MTTQQAKEVWQAALGELQLQLTRPSFETWLKDTVGLGHHDCEFIVGGQFITLKPSEEPYTFIIERVKASTLPGGTPGFPEPEEEPAQVEEMRPAA